MNKDWLKYKVESTEALEEEWVNEMKRDYPDSPYMHVPFGFINNEWLALKESMEEGDELWFFISEEYTWQTLCGREGYAVLRNGEPINCILTKRN